MQDTLGYTVSGYLEIFPGQPGLCGEKRDSIIYMERDGGLGVVGTLGPVRGRCGPAWATWRQMLVSLGYLEKSCRWPWPHGKARGTT